MKDRKPFPSKESGFTLVEMAIVMVIGGLLFAAISSFITGYARQAKINTTQERLGKINVAVREYLALNGDLPCPSSRIVPVNDSAYGIAEDVCNTTAAIAGMARENVTPVAPLTSEGVRIGMVPTRTLNIPDQYAYDAWGSRFIYAVTESLTDRDTYNTNNGHIDIIDQQATPNSVITPPGSGNFVVVSTGPDREGSYTSNGTVGPACDATAGQLDEENCDDDKVFRVAQKSDADTANYYDDYVIYMGVEEKLSSIPDGAIMPFARDACPEGWEEVEETYGRIIIGAGRFRHGALPSITPIPTTDPAPSYVNDQQGGSATRRDTAITGSPRYYDNMPPYVAYIHCVKTSPSYEYAYTPPAPTSASSSTSSTSTSSTSTTSSTSSGKSSGGKSSGGKKSGRVICTYFNNRRRLSKALLEMEQEHTYLYISDVTKRGYHFWAIPLVRLLQQEKYPWLEEIVYKITMWRVAEVAYQMGQSSKPNYLGKLVRLIGEPICYLIGHLVPQQDWQSLEAAYQAKQD